MPVVTVHITVHVYAKHLLIYNSSSAMVQCRAAKLGKQWIEIKMLLKCE